MTKLIWTAVCVAVFALGGVAEVKPDPAGAPKLSKPFEYSGYTKPEYTSSKTRSEYVMMTDGAKLAVDIHLPADGPERTAFPVIFEYTPYQRSSIELDTGRVHDVAGTSKGRFFLSYGYVIVVADMRGTGASMGWMMDFMPRLSKDGEQLVNWIAQQPWCDGHVGMMGSSYLGWSQIATASRAPKALKCITPECIPLDGFSGEAYPGGIFLQGFFNKFSPYMKMILQNENHPEAGVRPTKPVLDEDGDGALNDEIPVDANQSGSFLDDPMPPTYSDGQKRQGLYYLLSQIHRQANHDYAQWASKGLFIDSPTPIGCTMYDLSPSAYVPDVMRAAIPIYHFGGWFDAFTRGTFELYCTMAKSNPSKIIIAPSYHDFGSGPWWKRFGYTPEQVEQFYLIEHLRFFDRYLKEITNGIVKEPPIYLFVMNSGWRFEQEWPLARQTATKFFFDADNALVPARSQDGTDTYKADFSHSSAYTENEGNRYLAISGAAPQAPPMRTEKDKQCLTYTSAPFQCDTEVTGHPILHLWVSSTAEDGDFFVYLEDVGPAGKALLITEGQLRAGFAGRYANNTIVKAGKSDVDVLPKLPWHGYQKDQYDAKVFAKNEPVELVIDFQPTAWVLKQGHRARVTIACADYPTFQLHPKLSPQNKPDAPGNIVPAITVHREASHASWIALPVIPPAS